MNKNLKWKLTDDEATQLRAIWKRGLGVNVLLHQLQNQLGQEALEEQAWWDKVNTRLNIPSKYREHLSASHEEKTVWVNGEE